MTPDVGAEVEHFGRPGNLVAAAATARYTLELLEDSVLGLGVAQASSAPAVSLSPTSLTFASQATGTTSAPQTITAANTGTASLFFNNVAIGGADPLGFTIVDDECIGSTWRSGRAARSPSPSRPPRPARARRRSPTPTTRRTARRRRRSAGGGTGTTAPLCDQHTQFLSCSGGVCDVAPSSNVFVNNFFTTTFEASGDTPPYTWSGQVPAA